MTTHARTAGAPLAMATPMGEATPYAPPSATASATATAARFSASPGRPYDAAAVLLAMRPSRSGVPTDIEHEEIAAELARRIWTFDGLPYARLKLQAFCDETTCELYVTGRPEAVAHGGRHVDHYAFAVRRADRQFVKPRDLRATLQGYPPAYDRALDELARELMAPDELSGLTFEGASWRVPPETGVFDLQYGTGAEEGSPIVYVTLDVLHEKIVSVRTGSA